MIRENKIFTSVIIYFFRLWTVAEAPPTPRTLYDPLKTGLALQAEKGKGLKS